MDSINEVSSSYLKSNASYMARYRVTTLSSRSYCNRSAYHPDEYSMSISFGIDTNGRALGIALSKLSAIFAGGKS
jgi:hypothetical protein